MYLDLLQNDVCVCVDPLQNDVCVPGSFTE